VLEGPGGKNVISSAGRNVPLKDQPTPASSQPWTGLGVDLLGGRIGTAGRLLYRALDKARPSPSGEPVMPGTYGPDTHPGVSRFGGPAVNTGTGPSFEPAQVGVPTPSTATRPTPAWSAGVSGRPEPAPPAVVNEVAGAAAPRPASAPTREPLWKSVNEPRPEVPTPAVVSAQAGPAPARPQPAPTAPTPPAAPSSPQLELPGVMDTLRRALGLKRGEPLPAEWTRGATVDPPRGVPAEPLPMTRQHRPGEQIQDVSSPAATGRAGWGREKWLLAHANDPARPAPTPDARPIQPSATAPSIASDPVLKSALEVSEHWKRMHQKGFADGGRV
jgi:hypothetical protein